MALKTQRYGVLDLGLRDQRSLVSRLLTLPLFLLIRTYQLLIAPLLPPVCRFEPSCSRYAIDALRDFGPLRGSWLAARRIARCNPWGGSGFDPVPPRSIPDPDSAQHEHESSSGNPPGPRYPVPGPSPPPLEPGPETRDNREP